MDFKDSFGLDPVDLNHSDEHPRYHFVSEFVVCRSFPHCKDSSYKSYFVSWSNALTFKRFLKIFHNQIDCFEISTKVPCKLIRFNLNKYFMQLSKDFEIPNEYGDIDWNSLDDSGLIKLRSKKCPK